MPHALRLLSALVLAVVGVSSPVMGYAAAEEYESRKFYAVFEGDWFFLFGFIAAGACLWEAAAPTGAALSAWVEALREWSSPLPGPG